MDGVLGRHCDGIILHAEDIIPMAVRVFIEAIGLGSRNHGCNMMTFLTP